MSLSIPQELIEQLKKGNVVLFCGAGISMSEGGLPGGGQLARELAERAGRPAMADTLLPEVAQAYELEMGHQSLIEYIAGRIDNPRYIPLRTHQLIAALPFTKIVTTNWDNLLEEALRQARKPFVEVVRDADAAFVDEKKVLLVKLHGSIEQKDSLVITGDDYYDVFARLPETANLVRAYLAIKTILFLGFGLADEDFKRLYYEVVRHIGVHKRRAYAVQLDPDELTIKYWEEKNVKIIAADATAFLEALADALGKDIVAVAPPSEPTSSVARQPRRVDAALPNEAQVGQSIDLVIAVKLPESPRLDAKEIRDAGISRRFPDDAKAESKPVEVEFPVDERTGESGPATLEIQVIAPNFEIHGLKRKSLLVPPDRDSELCTFPLSPRTTGGLEVSVELYSQGVLVGTMRLETVVRSDSVPIDRRAIWTVATLPLVLVIAPSRVMPFTTLQPPLAKIEQHAGDHAIQIGQARDKEIKPIVQESTLLDDSDYEKIAKEIAEGRKKEVGASQEYTAIVTREPENMGDSDYREIAEEIAEEKKESDKRLLSSEQPSLLGDSDYREIAEEIAEEKKEPDERLLSGEQPSPLDDSDYEAIAAEIRHEPSAPSTESQTEDNGDTVPVTTPAISLRPSLVLVYVIAALFLGLVSNTLADMWQVDTPQRLLITVGVFFLALAIVLWAEFRRSDVAPAGASLLVIKVFVVIGALCLVIGIAWSIIAMLSASFEPSVTATPTPVSTTPAPVSPTHALTP